MKKARKLCDSKASGPETTIYCGAVLSPTSGRIWPDLHEFHVDILEGTVHDDLCSAGLIEGVDLIEEDNPYLVEDIIRSFAASDTLLLRQLNQARDEQVRLLQRLDEMEKRLTKAEKRLDAIRHPLRKALGKK